MTNKYNFRYPIFLHFSLDTNLPLKRTKCEKMFVKQQMARHKKSCDSGTLKCPKCPHFYRKRKEDLTYHLAKHNAPQDKKQCALYAWRNFQVSVLFNNIRDGNTEHWSNFESNPAKA